MPSPNFTPESAPSDSASLRYFQSAQVAWHRAQTAGKHSEQFFRVGGSVLRLCFAGDRLVSHLVPALAHLALAPVAEPDLTIGLWDSAETGVALAPPGEPITDPTRQEIRLFGDDQCRAIYQADSQSLSVVNFTRPQAFFQATASARIPSYEKAFPLRTIFQQWFGARGRHLTHAAAVGNANGAVLITGPGGTGKSTSALACLRAGLFYLGDDYTLLETTSQPVVHSVYSSAKLNADNVHRFPELSASLRLPETAAEKALLFLHEKHRVQLIPSLPIRALLLPQITGGRDSALVEAPPAVLLKALAPSTIFQLPGSGAVTFQALARLVSITPAYFLRAGADVSTIPPVITALLATA